jgi:hypothetical protein
MNNLPVTHYAKAYGEWAWRLFERTDLTQEEKAKEVLDKLTMFEKKGFRDGYIEGWESRLDLKPIDGWDAWNLREKAKADGESA